MRSKTPRRWVQALAVTLPLGLEPAGDGAAAPRVTLPSAVVADAEAQGAVGLVYHGGARPEVCGAVALRDRAQAPQLAALQWRAAAGPSRSNSLAVEKLPAAETPAGFVVWYACSPAAAPPPGAALSALLLQPQGPSGPSRRRVDLAAGQPEVWSWRALLPVEARADLGGVKSRAGAAKGSAVATPASGVAH